MSTEFKDRIAADLQKAKQASGTRAEKIRKIFQDALSQTVSELKEGAGDIRSIAQDSRSNLVDTLKQPSPQTVPAQATPVEIQIVSHEETHNTGDIPMEPTASNSMNPSESTEPTVEVIVDPTVNPTHDSPTEASAVTHVQTDPQTDAETAAPTGQAEATAQRLMETLMSLFDRGMNQLKRQEIYADLERQVSKLKDQLGLLDSQLASRYGDRYTTLKQDLQQDAQKAKAWYEQTRTHAAETGTYWVDEKQAELKTKAGEAGSTIAQKEQKIKHLLKELWHTIRE